MNILFLSSDDHLIEKLEKYASFSEGSAFFAKTAKEAAVVLNRETIDFLIIEPGERMKSR